MRRRLRAHSQPLVGLAFVVLLAGLVAASIVDYTGGFTSSTRVTLYVPDAGNQLSNGAQVKLHGAVVGTVDSIEPSARGARLTLALDPDETHLIPRNTRARVLPKTLVGQDYVDLVLPTAPSSTTVTTGDVIARDTSAHTVVLEDALDSLLEVLDAVPPEQVATTLNSLSTALSGRGKQLGETLSTLHEYLDGFNPSLPRLNEDIRALATFSHTYEEATPDLLAAVDHLSTTTRTIQEQQAAFDKLYASVTRAGDETREFLTANADNLIQLADVSRPTLATLARYAPEYPCLLGQLAGLVPRIDEIFGKGDARPALNITIRVTNSRGKYLPNQDEPEYLDERGPQCYPVVPLAPQYPAGGPIRDGSATPPGTIGAGGAPLALVAPTDRHSNDTGAHTGADTGLPGSAAESHLVAGLFGADGKPAPLWSSLLLGPLLRGGEVGVR